MQGYTMKMIFALLKHAILVMQLEHDGRGLPTRFVGAFLLVALYTALCCLNNPAIGDNMLGLTFVVFIYLFVLRTQVIGLIILIGIISSCLSLTLGMFGELSALHLVMISAMEYLLVFGALINTIKRHANLT
jgi:hypothetical protein